MTEHTPGPWKADDSKWIYAGDTYVAMTIGRNDAANAHLIAAAPDLLLVAEMAEAAMAFECGEAIAPEFEPRDLLDAARAAVAKARGGSDG
jgi:hypothetical protein